MSTPAIITAEVSPETLAAMRAMAAERGVSVEQLVGEMVRRAAENEADFLADIDEAERQFDRGDSATHEEFMAELKAEFGKRHAA